MVDYESLTVVQLRAKLTQHGIPPYRSDLKCKEQIIAALKDADKAKCKAVKASSGTSKASSGTSKASKTSNTKDSSADTAYMNMTHADLKELVRKREIPNRSNLKTKADMSDALRNDDKAKTKAKTKSSQADGDSRNVAILKKAIKILEGELAT
jgi:hypothetical protein